MRFDLYFNWHAIPRPTMVEPESLSPPLLAPLPVDPSTGLGATIERRPTESVDAASGVEEVR